MGANFDAAYTILPGMTEEECIQMCIDKFPKCSAVDYNLGSKVCAPHHAHTGLGHWQDNGCCNRYEIVSCDGSMYLSLISVITMQ